MDNRVFESKKVRYGMLQMGTLVMSTYAYTIKHN